MSLMRTGVGSLPHRDLDEAVAFVEATADIPYLPQLPNRNEQESMLVQWGSGIAGAGAEGTSLVRGGTVGDRSEGFAGAAAMLQSLDSTIVKTQTTGPVTIAAALRAGGVNTPELMHVVTQELGRRIRSHLRWIRSESDVHDVVLILDEPALAAVGGGDLPKMARDALTTLQDSIDTGVGLHCCGDTDWGSIAEIGFDWLSWDLGALDEGFFRGVDRIAEALGAGTRLMWGIVPTTPGPLPEIHVLMGRYGTAVANLIVAGAPFEKLKADAWFTPACGLAGLSVSDAEKVADKLLEVVGEVESGW